MARQKEATRAVIQALSGLGRIVRVSSYDKELAGNILVDLQRVDVEAFAARKRYTGLLSITTYQISSDNDDVLQDKVDAIEAKLVGMVGDFRINPDPITIQYGDLNNNVRPATIQLELYWDVVAS